MDLKWNTCKLQSKFFRVSFSLWSTELPCRYNKFSYIWHQLTLIPNLLVAYNESKYCKLWVFTDIEIGCDDVSTFLKVRNQFRISKSKSLGADIPEEPPSTDFCRNTKLHFFCISKTWEALNSRLQGQE